MIRAKFFPGAGQVVLVDSKTGENGEHIKDKILMGEGKLNSKRCWLYVEKPKGLFKGNLNEISQWATSEAKGYQFQVWIPSAK